MTALIATCLLASAGIILIVAWLTRHDPEAYTTNQGRRIPPRTHSRAKRGW